MRKVLSRDSIAVRILGRAAKRGISCLHWADENISSLKHRLLPDSHRIALFDVCNYFGFAAQAPVIRHLMARGILRVEVTSGALPTHELVRILGHYGIDNRVVVEPSAAARRKYDVCVITDDPTVRLWRRTKRAFLHHGSSFGNRASPYAFEILRDGVADYLLCLSSAEFAHGVSTFGESFNTRAAIVGAPKLDTIVNGHWDRPSILASLGLDPEKRTVLLASHWMPESLFRACDMGVLRDYFAAIDVNLLVVGHHHLFNIDSARFSGNIDWSHRLHQIFYGPRMRVIEKVHDNAPLMYVADMLVADHSSIHLEYAALYRPLVLYDNGVSYEDPILRMALGQTVMFAPSVDAMPEMIGDGLDRGFVDHGARQRLLDYAFDYLGRSGERSAIVLESLAKRGDLSEIQALS